MSLFKQAALLLTSLLLLQAHAAVDPIKPGDTTKAFEFVTKGKATPICIAPDAAKVIRIAADDLSEDIERVTGVRPEVQEGFGNEGRQIRVAVDPALKGQWEAFKLSATPTTLTITGSDSRAVAFGIYEISRRIGVSPWHWWADVPPPTQSNPRLSAGTEPIDKPAVRYRGIFINDEDWGLQPWAAKTFEPDAGTIGPKTHARIFELMLRLRANTLWPAMHKCTTAFHQVPGNNKVADDYAIVLGSSHAEPMLRNNVGEWKAPKNQYNYLTHRDELIEYWEERVRQRTKGESLFTIGMRGIHDSAIIGPKSQKERISTLESIFKDQRELLERHLGQSASQIFCPYKEVLPDYNAGLKVPEDVTLVWPDDNFGYIRHFPTAEERKRSGGSGVYYHLSYLGNPLSWLWFDSLPPALIWSEMHKAYEYGARDFWVGNVGDIKGNELSTAAFLDLAWNADTAGPDWAKDFLKRFAAQNFGAANTGTIVDLWQRHQALAFARKPEHLQWHLSLTPYQPTEMTPGEITERLGAYDALAHDAGRLFDSLPETARDAGFQLITYPLLCARAANQRYFQLELARRELGNNPLETAKSADREIGNLTRRYNEQIADGKWRGIMTAGGVSHRDWIRFQPTPFSKQSAGIEPLMDFAKDADFTIDPGKVPNDAKPGDFIEANRVVSINAGHFTAQKDIAGGGWRAIPGLGRSGSAVTVLPTTLSGQPSLSYRFFITSGGPATLHLRLLPTHPVKGGDQLRVAYAIDSGSPKTVTAKDHSPKSLEWKSRVMANATSIQAKIPKDLSPGWHTLHLVAIDPGVVVDKLVIDLGGLKPSYAGPPETRIPQ